MKKALVAVLFLVVMAVSLPAAASFYYICSLTGNVESFKILNKDQENPDVELILTLTEAKLEEGNITDPECNYSVGQKLKISTLPTAFEAAQIKNNPERTLKKEFNTGGEDLEKVAKKKTLSLHYRYLNESNSDSHIWKMGDKEDWSLF